MDPQPTPLEQTPAPNFAARTFTVYFSDPLAFFAAQPHRHWKLTGEGEISVEKDRVVLRGRRPRTFWFGAKAEIPIPLADIFNVIRAGSVVQCHVRLGGATTLLKLWLANEQVTERLVQQLPKERKAEVEQPLDENSSFDAALASLGTRPVITPALLIANCAIFGCTVYAGAGLLEPNGPLLIQWGTNYGPRTLDGEWWRLFTSMFLHFGVLHLGFNMWALWAMGRLIEKLYGSAYFLVLYIFAGLSGSLASLYWHPNLNSAGASGAIFGVLGGLFAFMAIPRTRIPASVAVVHRNSAVVFICYNLINGFTRAGIDNSAHLGGLVGGFAMACVLARPVDPQARQDPLRRLVLGTLLGAVVLIALSWPLFHPNPTVAAERRFRQQFELFAKAEEEAITAQHALYHLESSNKITGREWGRRLQAEVIPKWKTAEDQIAAAQLPADSRLVPLRAALLEYLDQQRFALDLLSDAARSNDPAKLELGTQVSNKNNAKAEEIKVLIRQLY